MKNSLPTQNKCCGCKACAEICPTGALQIKYDSLGFGYPEIKSKQCCECGECSAVCPAQNKPQPIMDLEKAVIAKTKDSTLLFESASGGAFFTLMSAWRQINHETLVCGVVYDDDFNACFIVTTEEDKINLMHKSKYMIADTSGVFGKVRDALNHDNSVFFSGTPCQCAALRNFLDKDYEKLLIIDLVCHGGPSNELFKKYIQEESEKNGAKIVEHTFRDKTLTDLGYQLRQASYTLENGKKKIFQQDEDSYSRMYYSRLGYRESCGTCPYANPERISDITICDAHNVKEIYPDMEGSSVIVFHNQKGYQLLPYIDKHMEARTSTVEWLTERNAQYKIPTKIHPNTPQFFSMINEGRGFEESVDACLYSGPIQKNLDRIFCRMKRLLKKLLVRMKK